LPSRTDAGVHARGQVASFLTRKPFDESVFVDGLNYWLPDDIAVRRAREVAIDFDVRRRARRRLYRCLVHNDRAPSPLLRQRSWHVKQPLDATAMQKAAACLVGRHDFAAFAGAPETPGASTVRTMHRFDVRRLGRLVSFEAEADAFLPHQVRRTVGALVEVGLGRQTPQWFEELLREGAPATAGPAAPSQGLCLMQVTYRTWILTKRRTSMKTYNLEKRHRRSGTSSTRRTSRWDVWRRASPHCCAASTALTSRLTSTCATSWSSSTRSGAHQRQQQDATEALPASHAVPGRPERDQPGEDACWAPDAVIEHAVRGMLPRTTVSAPGCDATARLRWAGAPAPRADRGAPEAESRPVAKPVVEAETVVEETPVAEEPAEEAVESAVEEAAEPIAEESENVTAEESETAAGPEAEGEQATEEEAS
jgi:tRNA pseudouridine38-40 synthase